MRGLLLTAAAAVAFLTPPAHAQICQWPQGCPGMATVCSVVGCPTPIHKCVSTGLLICTP